MPPAMNATAMTRRLSYSTVLHVIREERPGDDRGNEGHHDISGKAPGVAIRREPATDAGDLARDTAT